MPPITLESLRTKHDARDMSVFLDFEHLVLAITDDDVDIIRAVWVEFPTASWPRASGHLIEHLLDMKRYNTVRLFWEHDIFRMAGRNMATQTRLEWAA